MTDNIATKDLNYDRANVFCDEKTKVHISKSSGTFYNGIIVRVRPDFFFIIDEKKSQQLVFFSELNKPIEVYQEEE